jgi:hypothetical protein
VERIGVFVVFTTGGSWAETYRLAIKKNNKNNLSFIVTIFVG